MTHISHLSSFITRFLVRIVFRGLMLIEENNFEFAATVDPSTVCCENNGTEAAAAAAAALVA